MEKGSYFKCIFKFALLWSPLKRVICSSFSHMKWETLHRHVTEEGTSYLNRLSKLLLSLHPPMVAPVLPWVCSFAEVCASCRHNGFLTPQESWWLIHLPLQKCQHRGTCGWVVKSCRSCSSLGRHLHKPGAAPFPGAGRSLSEPAPNRALPWALARPSPCSGAASMFEQSRSEGNQSTHPFHEEALLQHSSLFLHRGQQEREQSPHRELPETWQPVPLHMICSRKLIFLCSPPPPMWRTLPSLFSSLPTCETLVTQRAGSDILPALREVKQRGV